VNIFNSSCPRNNAGSFLAANRFPSAAAGRRATILQSPPIIAGLPSAVAWSHPTAEGIPSTADFAGKQAVQRKDAEEPGRGQCHDLECGDVSPHPWRDISRRFKARTCPRSPNSGIASMRSRLFLCAFMPLRLCVGKLTPNSQQ